MQLVVKAATKQFGGREVFSQLSMLLRPGRITALVGPSGSGKTTLLAAMAGLISLDSGQIYFVGSSGIPVKPRLAFVAWVPQGSNALPSRTALDNVMIGPLAQGASVPDARARSCQALDRVHMLDLKSARVRSLSGGELQRVCFARALASGKSCVFADEPTSNLDVRSTAELAAALGELADRSTIIVVATHDERLLSAADDVIYLRQR